MLVSIIYFISMVTMIVWASKPAAAASPTFSPPATPPIACRNSDPRGRRVRHTLSDEVWIPHCGGTRGTMLDGSTGGNGVRCKTVQHKGERNNFAASTLSSCLDGCCSFSPRWPSRHLLVLQHHFKLHQHQNHLVIKLDSYLTLIFKV